MAKEDAIITISLIDKFSGTFKRINKAVQGTKKRLQTLGRSLKPLVTRFAALGTAIAGGAAIRKSLQLAEKQVKAEAKLLAALKGQGDELTRIQKIASQIQSETIIGDEDLIDTAALLVNMGVSTERIDDALRAAVDTSQALGAPIALVARAIGRFGTGTAGLLGQRVPELVELAAQGKLAAEGIDFLRERFRGTSQEIAKTDFGQVTQQLNALGDAFEQQGNIFVQFQTIILKGAVEAFNSLNEAMKSEQFRNVITVAKVLLGELSKFAPQLLAIIGALAAIQIAVFVTPLLVIGTQIGLIVGGLALIATLLPNITSETNKLRDSTTESQSLFGSIGSDIAAIFKEVAEGKITVEDIFDIALTRLRVLALQIRKFVLTPVVNFILGLIKLIIGGIGSAVTTVQIGVVKAISAILVKLNKIFPDFDNNLRKLARQIVVISGRITRFILQQVLKVVKILPESVLDIIGLAETDITSTLKALNKGIIEVNTTILADSSTKFADAIDKKIIPALERAQIAAGKIVIEGSKLIFAGTGGVGTDDREIEGQERALEGRILGRRAARRQVEQKQDRADRKVAQQEVTRNLAEQATLEAQFRALKEGKDFQSQQRTNASRIAELNRLNELEKIGFQDFIKEREALETQAIDTQIAATAKQLEAAQEAIDARRAEGGATADVRLQLTQVITLQRQLNDLTGQRQQALEGTNDARRQEAARIQAELSATAGKAREAITANNELAEAGQASVAETLEKNRQIVDQFTARSGAAAQQLAAATSTLPQTEVDALIANLGKVGSELDRLEPKVESLFGGFTRGAQEATQEVATLGVVGAAVGSGLTQSVAGNLTDAFSAVATGAKSASDAFKDFARGVIADIAKLLIRIAVLRAVGGVFGGGGIPFAQGGPVPGPNVNADVVSARLTPGEFVIKKDATSFYGNRAMAAVNARMVPPELLRKFSSGKVPRSARGFFQAGGAVTTPTGQERSDQQGFGLSIIASSAEGVERLNAGGRNAQLQFIEDNASEINSALNADQRR